MCVCKSAVACALLWRCAAAIVCVCRFSLFGAVGIEVRGCHSRQRQLSAFVATHPGASRCWTPSNKLSPNSAQRQNLRPLAPSCVWCQATTLLESSLDPRRACLFRCPSFEGPSPDGPTLACLNPIARGISQEPLQLQRAFPCLRDPRRRHFLELVNPQADRNSQLSARTAEHDFDV